jgi:hypothetical protein
LSRRRPQEGYAPRVKVHSNSSASRSQHGTPDFEALQDRLLPLACGALSNFKMRCHVLDGAEKLEVEGSDSLQHPVTTSIAIRVSAW